MGKTKDIVNYKQKNTLLYGKNADQPELSRLGQELLAAGRLNDAIDFFAHAQDKEGLATVRRQSIEEGDVFLFRQILRTTDEEPSEQDWRSIGERARSLGKWQFAREAFRMVSDRKAMDEIDRLIAPKKEEENLADQAQDPAL